MKLLLIEDDRVDQMAFKRWVAKELDACHLSIANSIEEGKIKVQKEEDFEFIICDYFLPDGDISDFIKWVDPTQVICISGISDPKQLAQIETLGIQQFFFKDPQLSYLHKLKNHLLSLHTKQQEKTAEPISTSAYTIPQLEHLKNTFDNNPEPIKDIIQIFLEQTPRLLHNLQQALLEKDPKATFSLAHRLKSNFRMMGLLNSMKKLEEIERSHALVVEKNQYFLKLTEEIQIETTQAYQALNNELETL